MKALILCPYTGAVYAATSEDRSNLILVRLPSTLLAKIDRHARLIGATRTALLTHILERGLIQYLHSQATLTKTHNEALKTASAPDNKE